MSVLKELSARDTGALEAREAGSGMARTFSFDVDLNKNELSIGAD